MPITGQIPYDREVFDCVRRSMIPVSCAGNSVKSSYKQLFDSLSQIIDKKERKQ